MSKRNIGRQSEKILIVDEHENMRKTLTDIFTDEGYQVSTAATGEEATKLCSKRPHEIIFIDVRVPGIDDVETFRQIRRHQEGVRVILMSAYSVDDLKTIAIDEGEIAFLSKPLDLEQVINLIGEAKDTAVLVAEDDEHTAGLLSTGLKKQGYRVTIAKSPHDALELVEQIRFDLIFLDANLPSMNGLELYLAIKKITPTAVAIMISDMEKEFEEIAQEAVRRNAYTIVRKPLDIDHILDLLHRFTCKRVSGDDRKPPL